MLIPKEHFIGLDGVVHLAAGGEAPALRAHLDATRRFWEDKALGEPGRTRFEQVYQRCKSKTGELLQVAPDTIAFLSSSSEGVNLVAHALDWQPGDNVVVADIEFASDVLPWLRLRERGVELRIVPSRNWVIHLDDVSARIDDRTRVVAASLVSYFTGQRLDLAALSALVRRSQALLLVDVTHAAGVMPIEAALADIVISSCYKWLLATHGLGIFYWNPERLPWLEPPFLGWHSCETIPQWDAPTAYRLKADGGRFEPANPSFLGIYVLDSALDHLLPLGLSEIEAHVVALSGRLRRGLEAAGYRLMTPVSEADRLGNICFIAEDVDRLVESLAEENILVWGSYAGVERVRVSTHVYNETADVDRLLDALDRLRTAQVVSPHSGQSPPS